MRLDEWTLRDDRRGIDVVYQLHCMWVPHRDGGNFHCLSSHVEHLDGFGRVADERYARWLQDRYTHIDGHLTVRLEPWRDDAGQGFNTNLAFVGQTLFVHKTHKAPCAIATLLDFTTVGVKDPVTEVDARLLCAFNQQQLVATDTEMAIGQKTDLGRR